MRIASRCRDLNPLKPELGLGRLACELPRPCAEETCKKGQFCYSPDDGKDTCQDEFKQDPSLISWLLIRTQIAQGGIERALPQLRQGS